MYGRHLNRSPGQSIYWLEDRNKPLSITSSPLCGGLNENVPHRLQCLNTRSSVHGTVWGGSKAMALLKEVDPQRQSIRLYRV